jgi:SutA-like transcriptional regulator|tara:strand:- start:1033 stop:1236 length:204 start_codon:yes stop_codon:yes gene_type:complete
MDVYLLGRPTVNLENTMSKKPEKVTLTSATIEEQTAAFLKSGGAVEYVGKGKSGQETSQNPKQITLK